MTAQLTLETTRLNLRPLYLSDARSLQKVISISDIADTMISIPYPYPDSEAERYIRKKIAEFESGNSVTFVIEPKEKSFLRGVIEIREIEPEHSQAELSFWLAVECWGKGYMTEALKPVLNFCFNHLHLNRIYSYHMTRNLASGRVLKKNGFVREGILRQRVKKWGVFEDVVILAILRKDWQN
ncbi:GNAT family N-acetyltransferase [Mastigocoleus testarum]|uniref:Acetyltransferase n=1 Tax=Mastigocoleus testarum BC008 TaxID=371196 RepID=A0A0V7ZYC5_9CYAN|nr:GNAT family N-acetyltransferase [Mastigocoleus testarum]KST69488.1 acetyltransferase [Mastigocoleus testarum BC008]KST69546.1 acetyltransferase [Mastigocoleus testarum BC008]